MQAEKKMHHELGLLMPSMKPKALVYVAINMGVAFLKHGPSLALSDMISTRIRALLRDVNVDAWHLVVGDAVCIDLCVHTYNLLGRHTMLISYGIIRRTLRASSSNGLHLW